MEDDYDISGKPGNSGGAEEELSLPKGILSLTSHHGKVNSRVAAKRNNMRKRNKRSFDGLLCWYKLN